MKIGFSTQCAFLILFFGMVLNISEILASFSDVIIFCHCTMHPCNVLQAREIIIFLNSFFFLLGPPKQTVSKMDSYHIW